MTTDRLGGWTSGACPPQRPTALEAHELERQIDAAKDLLGDASALQDRYSDARVLGMALARLESLADAAREILEAI